MVNTTKVCCITCNKSFEKETSQIKHRPNHFCSPKCYRLYGKQKHKERPDESSKYPSLHPIHAKSVEKYPYSNKWPLESQTRASHRKKIWCIEYKGGQCELCGYKNTPSALEFHHKNPLLKKFEIGVSKLTTSKEDLSTELDKCALLCANCHREVHDGTATLM